MSHLWIVLSVIFVLTIILLSGCIAQDNTDYALETKNLDSQQVLEYYFNAWNEKNISKMTAVEPRAQKIMWEMEYLNYVKIISIEPQKERTASFEHLQRYYEENIYLVRFEIDFKDGHGSGFTNGQTTWFYQLAKETEDSPWLIYAYGGGY